jgi:hypothetical protein
MKQAMHRVKALRTAKHGKRVWGKPLALFCQAMPAMGMGGQME